MHHFLGCLFLGLLFFNSFGYAKKAEMDFNKQFLHASKKAALTISITEANESELKDLDKKFTAEWKVIMADVAQDPVWLDRVIDDRKLWKLKRDSCKHNNGCLKKFYTNFFKTLEGENPYDWIGHYTSSNGRLLIYPMKTGIKLQTWLVTLNTLEPTSGKWMCNTGATVQIQDPNINHLTVKIGHQKLELLLNKDNSIDVLDTPELHSLEQYWCGNNGSLRGTFRRDIVK